MARALDANFITAQVYAIYKAITEVCGPDGWKITWRAGELVFDQIEPKLWFASDAPLDVLRTVGDYLVDVGYLDAIDLDLKPGGVLEYAMCGTTTREATHRLIDENGILPHWSTSLMAAALRKRCGVEARMEDHEQKPALVGDRQAQERWLLTKDGVPIS